MERDAREDLALIRRVMEESRRAVVDRGMHFIIWGTLPALGMVATYVRVATGEGPNPLWAWIAVLVLSWSASMVVGWREGRRAPVKTLAYRLLTAMWVSVGVSLTIVGIAGMFGPMIPTGALAGLVATMLAPAVLVAGLLTQQPWLGWVAVGWWTGAAVMLFFPGLYILLLMAVMSVLLLALPGALLMRRASRPRPQQGTPGSVGSAAGGV